MELRLEVYLCYLPNFVWMTMQGGAHRINSENWQIRYCPLAELRTNQRTRKRESYHMYIYINRTE